jgi:hypothetical protein
LPALTEARQILIDLGSANPLTREQRTWLAWIEEQLARAP